MKPSLAAPVSATSASANLSSRLIKRLIWQRLRCLKQGYLTVIDGRNSHHFGRPDDPLRATVRILDSRAYRMLALRGSIGIGESYMDGDWSCDDLTQLMRIFVCNRDVLDSLEHGLARAAMLAFRAGHRLRHNSRDNSRRNIADHYDLGNDFYQLFLDPTMMYSSAVFPHPQATLEQASLSKLERICVKLDLRPEDHLLEIGTGWGGLALYAAGRYGCRVTTATISEQQHRLARQRVAEAGLADQIEVLLCDYRDLRGKYDKLVSIEMIEAVGHRYFDTYFKTCDRLLKDDGMMLLQAITIADRHYESAKRAVDFIQRYIFPGGFLPSLGLIGQTLARATDMNIFHLEDIGPHYALTLRHWRERFTANLDKVRAQGFPESFIRMWEFYLCYCEGGFRERAIGTVQVLLTKPDCRRASLAPALS